MMKKLLLFLFLPLFISCSQSENRSCMEYSSKPFARYWWFASVIKKEDVRYNLDWLKQNGFGGVELAWVYPLNRFNPLDTTYTPRQEWLSPEWSEIVEYTISYCDTIGLECDLTLGTLWPFGDSRVSFENATRRYGDPEWRQVITRSWEHPLPGYVVDHITPSSYLPYFDRLIAAFPRPVTKLTQSYFIDSWEVETKYLWSDSFASDFKTRFSYDIIPFMDSLYTPDYSMYLYDYMSLLSDKVISFYDNFDLKINETGLFSRGQVSGAPCDLISGYARLDIPEGESMLFEPEFCAIPASSALLTGKKVVSAESFTCLYGWPDNHLHEEQTADLKLVADALFANGVNHIIWHGKPHNPASYDTVSFYASTHVGPSGYLTEDLPSFNKYLETVSSYLKRGDTYCDIAVYLPTEDAWIDGEMAKEKQFIWAWGQYEMRYIYFPEELDSYNPVWINYEFLEKGDMKKGNFIVGNTSFSLLYLDSRYLDYKVVKRVADLVNSGLKVVLKQIPREPGVLKHEDYELLLGNIISSRQNISSLPDDTEPFITGETIPPHWCRKENEDLFIFFSNPAGDRLEFPLEYGQSFNDKTEYVPLIISCSGDKYELNLEFKPYQSLLYHLKKGKAEQIDIEFTPPVPERKERPADFEPPWLVR